MTWIHPLTADSGESIDVLGGKAHGLVGLRRIGIAVPPGFVVGTGAHRHFRRAGRFPEGLGADLAAAVSDLEAATGRRLGGPERPLAVAVRSGAAVPMPGMMSTVLGVGLTGTATAALAAETGDPGFALDSRLRFLTGFAATVLGLPPQTLAAAAAGADRAAAIARVEALVRERTGAGVPDDAGRQLDLAVRAVLASWESPRARTYRALHGIPHDLGTAVTVQAMVFGNRDERSGTGVAFSRDPNTGAPVPFGEVLFGHQGEDVVSGRAATRPLPELAGREPAVWAGLLDALERVERHHRDVCSVEFTFEAGELWLLQVRSGGLAGRAAVRVAVDLADEGLIGRRDALLRVSPRHLGDAATPRIDPAGADVLARGIGACPGVAAGRIATTADRAVRMAADGPVVLVRPETSPLDMHGLAAAAGVVTARGGPAGHAAVVARALGRPAVVGATGLTVDETAGDATGCVRAGGRTVEEGTFVTIDGTGGDVVVGRPRVVPAAADPHLHRLLGWADEVTGGGPARSGAERIAAARTALAGP